MLDQVKNALKTASNPEKAAFFPRFFKAGPGEYAEGDVFLGVTVPDQRAVAKQYYQAISLKETVQLLHSKQHEYRLTALFILVLKYKKFEHLRREIFELYIENTKFVNNWDLVDSSADPIVGAWLHENPYKIQVLSKLAKSKVLWERRIAMIATFYDLKQKSPEATLAIAELLINDNHDLIHKAVGWMLREMGKKVDRQLLLDFLDKHAKTMPRTMLRYAIEHLPPAQKSHYMGLKNS